MGRPGGARRDCASIGRSSVASWSPDRRCTNASSACRAPLSMRAQRRDASARRVPWRWPLALSVAPLLTGLSPSTGRHGDGTAPAARPNDISRRRCANPAGWSMTARRSESPIAPSPPRASWRCSHDSARHMWRWVDAFGASLPAPFTVRLYASDDAYGADHPLARKVGGNWVEEHRPRREASVVAPTTADGSVDVNALEASVRYALAHQLLAHASNGRLPSGLQEGMARLMTPPSGETQTGVAALRSAMDTGALIGWTALIGPGSAYIQPEVGGPESLSIAVFLVQDRGFGCIRMSRTPLPAMCRSAPCSGPHAAGRSPTVEAAWLTLGCRATWTAAGATARCSAPTSDPPGSSWLRARKRSPSRSLRAVVAANSGGPLALDAQAMLAWADEAGAAAQVALATAQAALAEGDYASARRCAAEAADRAAPVGASGALERARRRSTRAAPRDWLRPASWTVRPACPRGNCSLPAAPLTAPRSCTPDLATTPAAQRAVAVRNDARSAAAPLPGSRCSPVSASSRMPGDAGGVRPRGRRPRSRRTATQAPRPVRGPAHRCPPAARRPGRRDRPGRSDPVSRPVRPAAGRDRPCPPAPGGGARAVAGIVRAPGSARVAPGRRPLDWTRWVVVAGGLVRSPAPRSACWPVAAATKRGRWTGGSTSTSSSPPSRLTRAACGSGRWRTACWMTQRVGWRSSGPRRPSRSDSGSRSRQRRRWRCSWRAG